MNCFSQDFSTEVVQKIYTIADGLPSNEVHYIYEDDKNYLWFCTDEGLSRFDGINFKNYDQKDGLAEAFVLKLKKLKSGKTIGWTLHGSIFYFEEGNIENIAISGSICRQYGKCIITDIVDDAMGNLYISNSDRNGYVKIDSQGKIEAFDSMVDPRPSVGLIYKTIKVDSQRFSYFKRNKRIKRNKKSNNSEVLLFNEKIKIVTKVSQFGNSRPLELNGDFYQIIDDKLIVTNENKSFVIELPEPCWSLSLKDSTLLLFSHFYGYFEYSIQDKKLIDKKKKYPHYSMTNFLCDSRDIDWIATHSSGIIRNTPNKVKVVKSDFLEGKYIHKTRKSSDGSIFVLADENEFKKASLWKLSRDLKVTKVDEDIVTKVMFQEIEKDNSILYFNRVGLFCGFVSKRSRPESNQLNLFLISLDEFYSENDDVNLSHKMVFRDSCLFSVEKNFLSVHCNDRQRNQSLVLDERMDIRSISASERYIFLGTKNKGLFFVDIATMKVSKFDKELSSNHIKSISIQSDDTLFISTIEGVHRLIFTNNSFDLKGFVNYNNGLPVQEINDIHYFNDSLLITYPNSIHLIPVKLFDEVEKLTTKPFISDVEYSSAEEDEGYPLVKYNDNYIRFSFSNLYFGNPLKETIWYRLKGHKEEWSQSASGNLEYISLPPNRYTFEIARRDDSNNDFLLCDRFEFEIDTPFYLSKWMYLVYGISSLIIFGLLFLLVRKYDRLKQERIFSLKSLRLKVLMSQLNPHFIFNVLNGIQSLIVDNKTVRASDKLADFSRLLRNTLDASDRPLITIKDDIKLIKEYSNFEILRKSGAIEIFYKIDESVVNFFTPPLLIQPLIENSIRHGMNNTSGQKGKIEITIERHDNHIYYCVKDNGAGMKHKPKSEFGKGIQLVQERVKIINEKNKVDDNFTIKSDGEGTSTTFNLSQIKKAWK